MILVNNLHTKYLNNYSHSCPQRTSIYKQVSINHRATSIFQTSIYKPSCYKMGFSGGANGKEPTCQCRRQKTCVQSLGEEDPLEKEMATHVSILAWRIPWTEEPGGLQSLGSQRVKHN